MVNTQPTPTSRTPIQADLITTPFEPNENDIIDDILRRIIALTPGFTAAMAAQVDKQVREQWGGDRPYISLRRGGGASSRNAAIKRDYLAGEHIPLLERRYKLGKSRLWEIIKS